MSSSTITTKAASRILGYEIIEEIASTLQGRIYKGYDLYLRKYVIIKEAWKQCVNLGVVKSGHAANENFLNELKIIMELSKVNGVHDIGIIRGYKSWNDNNSYYYSADYYELSLLKYTNNNIRLIRINKDINAMNKWRITAKCLFKNIVKSVAFLHSVGVAHMDLSLENVMLTTDKHNNLKTKLIDFGLSHCINHNNGSWYSNRKNIGKALYLSPEIYYGVMYDTRKADIWSLGVILFMLTSCLPALFCYEMLKLRNVGGIIYLLKKWNVEWMFDNQTIDLLNKIFVTQDKRINLKQLINDPFFNDIPDNITVPKPITINVNEQMENKDNYNGNISPSSSISSAPNSDINRSPSTFD